jgi:predicted DNA-binding protein
MTTKISIRLPTDLRQQIEKEAKEKGITASDLIRQKIERGNAIDRTENLIAAVDDLAARIKKLEASKPEEMSLLSRAAGTAFWSLQIAVEAKKAEIGPVKFDAIHQKAMAKFETFKRDGKIIF